MSNNMEPVYGNGKICYVEIPATDINVSVDFYKNVFDWKVRRRNDGRQAFDDGVGQVSGTRVQGVEPASEVSILIHIMVDDIHHTVGLIEKNGGKIVQEVGKDAPEITARFADPAGNIFGLYQQPS